MDGLFSPNSVWVNGPIIVGAGPAGLAVAASLREQGVPSVVVLEREDSISSIWERRTYDRLKLHLSNGKQFCELPGKPFPTHYPTYPTSRQFIDYLESYATTFDVKPEFGSTVQSARYDETSGLWRVHVTSAGVSGEVEYIGRWLVVATWGNSGMEVPGIDHRDDGAPPSMSMGAPEVGGSSSIWFESFRNLAACRFPLWFVGKMMVLIFHTLAAFGFTKNSAELTDGTATLDVDAVVMMATAGEEPKLAQWLQDSNRFFGKDGYPKTVLPHGWMGQSGLYLVGFARRGLPAGPSEAVRVAKDIGQAWRKEKKPAQPCHRRSMSVIF